MSQKPINKVLDPERSEQVVKAIDAFFAYTPMETVEQALWEMLSASITNPREEAAIVQISERMHVYRHLVDLLRAIEPPGAHFMQIADK